MIEQVKRLSFLLMAVIVSILSMAQNTRGTIKYGAKAGLNITNMSNDMAFDPNFKMGTGLHIGGILNIRGREPQNSSPNHCPLCGAPLTEHNAQLGNRVRLLSILGLQIELMYSNQAVKTDAGDIKMNYIAVPLLLKVYPTTAFSLEVGPEFSYLMSTSPSTMAVDGAEIKVGDCKGMNVGLAAGLAYDFEMGLTVGARYTYGFTDMAKNLKWKNSNIQVTVGWMF